MKDKILYNDYDDFVYIEKDILFNKVPTLIFLTIAFAIMNFINSIFFEGITLILILILVFSITNMMTTTFKFSNDRFCIESTIYFTIIGILKILEMVILASLIFNSPDNMVERNLRYFDFAKLLEVSYIYIIFRYMDYIKNDFEITVNVDKILVAIIVIIFCVCLMGINKSSIYWSTNILLFLATLYRVLKYKILQHNNINFFVIYLICLSVSNFGYFINYLVNPSGNIASNIFIFIINIFNLYAYIVLYYSVLEILLNKPYKALFADLYSSSISLFYINKTMRKKIKEFKKSQFIIKDREHIVMDVFNNIPLSMLVVNNKNNRIWYVNKSLLNLVGTKNAKGLINKNIFDILTVDKGNKYNDCMEIFKKNDTAIMEIDNKNFTLDVQAIDISEENKCVLMIKDVTERSKIENMKKKLVTQELEEKMRNDFLSNISHDLKTPINVIYSATQLQNILIGEKNIDVIEKYNNINKDNCFTLIRLANNLIDSSKLSNNYLEPRMSIFNIVETIEETADALVEYIKNKDLSFIFDTEYEEVFVKCDKDFIKRIVINIISNAIKYTEKGGIFIRITKKEGKVIVVFKDTGKGMDEKFVNEAFNRYTIGKNKHNNEINKSSGIGLYVVKSLVELQNGNITLKSSKGKGTSIIIEFKEEEVNDYEGIYSS